MSGLAIAPVVVAPITSSVAFNALEIRILFCLLHTGAIITLYIVCFPAPGGNVEIA